MTFCAIFPLLLSLIICISAQETKPKTLLEELTPTINPVNEVADLLFPNHILSVETPIAIRYVLITTVPYYTILAACHRKALGFLGKKDVIPDRFCEPLPQVVLISYIQNRLFRSQFPIEGRAYEEFLVRIGLNPTSKSIDRETEVGLANALSDELVRYFETDGWNSLGDLARENFRQQYADYTGFKPKNHAELDVSSLRQPLRWQPLKQESDFHGRFASQVHVVPHIGRAKPLVLTQEDFNNRRSQAPYSTPDRLKMLSSRDEKTMRRLISELFRRSKNLTTEQVAIAHWWDSKFFSLGSFILYYQGALEFDFDTGIRIGLGEVLAQYDAVMLAWKEKVRHDLVRPTTMIRRLLKGKKVRAFKGFGKGVGVVDAEEWEPIVRVQPHSEFPSASALICKSSLDQLRASLKEIVGINGTIPPYEADISPFMPGNSPVSETVRVKFNTLESAAKSCGESRLFAGVHFSPSVPAGFELADGIGEKAHQHVADLWAGRVPQGCDRCTDEL